MAYAEAFGALTDHGAIRDQISQNDSFCSRHGTVGLRRCTCNIGKGAMIHLDDCIWWGHIWRNIVVARTTHTVSMHALLAIWNAQLALGFGSRVVLSQ